MAFDVKEMIEKIVDKAKNDPKFMDELKKNPEKAVEGLLGIDIPDGAIDKIVNGVKGKIALDKLGGIGDLFK